MALAPTPSPLTPVFLSSTNFKPSLIFLARPPLCPLKIPRSVLSSASSSSNNPPSPIASEQAILDAVAEFGGDQSAVPAVRTFENDLARLTLVGAVDFQQALTAAAADGGEAADEHILCGADAMVVETIFPGPVDAHSTVSTRLFLPARKVKEKAMKLKGAFSKDIFEGTPSKNILAMTFRQVVLRRLWNLELVLFRPGIERNMDDLENPREVPVLLTLSSSEDLLISKIAEVVCLVALENTERKFHHDSTRASEKFGWFRKRNQVSSSDNSVILHNFLEDEILSNAKILLEKFNVERGKHNVRMSRLKSSCWMPPTFSTLEKFGGLEFCSWISEWVPSYKLVIDAGKFNELKFDGGEKSITGGWEVLLTHSQMVSLSDILDMYYEDIFTLPMKRLPCSAVAKPSSLGSNKGSSLMKIISMVLAGGIFLVAIRFFWPHLPSKMIHGGDSSQPQLLDVGFAPSHSVESSQLETCCVSVIEKLKESFGWTGEIRRKSGVCAWIGELPTYLRDADNSPSNSHEISSTSISSASNEAETKPLQDIASYQIEMSTTRNVIEFKPTNAVAANNWAANPLAKDVYGGKNLSPGLGKRGLDISPSSEDMAVLELWMSVNPDSCFALVKPVDGKSQ